MRVDPVLHPVGPRAARVYWTRRVVTVAVVVVAVVLLARACSGGSTTPRATPPATPSPTPSATATTVAGACTAADLAVAAATDATAYPAGVLPRLRATIRTRGRACALPAGAVGWQVISGTDLVWSSASCPPTGVPAVEVRPNHPVRFGLVWDRHRSGSSCASPGAAAAPGTYQLFVAVRGVKSGPAVFHLTG